MLYHAMMPLVECGFAEAILAKSGDYTHDPVMSVMAIFTQPAIGIG